MAEDENLEGKADDLNLNDEDDEDDEEKQVSKWGDPISPERQAELEGYLDRWQAETDHGERKGPFDREPGADYGIRLTGADVFWLAELSGRDIHGEVPNLHLEYAALVEKAHLEGAKLSKAHLEHANFTFAHLERADLKEAHLEQAELQTAHLEGANLKEAHLERASLIQAHLETLYVNPLW
jgi:Pentapeptide repeats (8 copies)